MAWLANMPAETLQLGWLLATLIAFWLAERLYRFTASVWLHPVGIASLMLMALIWLSGSSYQEYRAANQPLLFLLGMTTVALAVPLAEQLERLKKIWPIVLLSVVVGSLAAMLSAVGLAWALDMSPDMLRTLVPKSVTTPIAMSLAAEMGGISELAAAIVVTVGIIGASIGPGLLSRIGVTDPAAAGVALGLSAHGVGTARALEIDRQLGAYAGLAMGLTGLCTSLWVALIILWWAP